MTRRFSLKGWSRRLRIADYSSSFTFTVTSLVLHVMATLTIFLMFYLMAHMSIILRKESCAKSVDLLSLVFSGQVNDASLSDGEPLQHSSILFSPDVIITYTLWFI